MELIITERGKTWSAYMQGKEWTTYGIFESNLENLRDYLARVEERERRQGILRVEGNAILIDFSNKASIFISQIIIDHNQTDHAALVAELISIYTKAD